MSAIAGVVHYDHNRASTSLERLAAGIRPCGPEGLHSWHQASAGLCRALWRTTPEDAFDRQPVQVGDLVLVFAGRLDHRDELERDLALPAPRARLLADSELAALAWGQWDEDCLARLAGDFALAVWRPRARRLYLARSPLGLRPLYWHQGPTLCAFASRAAALHNLPGIPRQLNEEYLADFLTLLPKTGDYSPWLGIQRVEPGCCVVLEEGRRRTIQFHRWDPERRIELPRDEDYVEAFREHFEQAVRTCLRASTPIGIRLSSGFDSTTLAAVSALQLARRNEGLTAFTAVPPPGFSGPIPDKRPADEGPGAAALAARHPNITHLRVSSNRDLMGSIDAYAQTEARPVQNPCNMRWIDSIDQMAGEQGIRVMFTGARGNLGISRDGLALLPQLLRQGQWLRWARESKALHDRGRMPWKSVFKYAVAPLLPPALWRLLLRGRHPGARIGLYSAIHPDFARDMDIQGRATRAGLDLSYRPWEDGRTHAIMMLGRNDFGDDHLNALTRHGIEWRHPLGNVRLLEYCLAIPEAQFLSLGRNRWLLRRAYGHLLPDEVLKQRRRGFQGAEWFEALQQEKSRLAGELERLSASPTARRVLDLQSLRQAVEHWPDAGWDQPEIYWTYRFKLLRGIAVGHFIHAVEGGNE